jgi:hypothetical protein
MSRNEANETVCVVPYISRYLAIYLCNPVRNVIDRIIFINIPETEITFFSFCYSFVLDKFSFMPCLIASRINANIDKERTQFAPKWRSIFCWKKVPTTHELIYLLGTPIYGCLHFLCSMLFYLFRAWQNKLNRDPKL